MNVNRLFPESALNVPWMCPDRSLNVVCAPSMFPECCLNGLWMFP
jgi:hypothetical protein